MSKAWKIPVLIVLLVILALSVFMLLRPEYEITAKQAGDLEKDDEVVAEGLSYFFQNRTPALGNTPLIKLTFLDSNGRLATINTEPTTLLAVKVPVPFWTIMPASPPPPRAAPVPIPVPVPPPASAPVPAPPNVNVPAPPNITPTVPPSPPNATLPLPPQPNATNATPAPSAVCGNGVVEATEQCEPPNTPSCNANCMNVIPAYPPSCYDSAWNGNESDMDCGGSCPKCLNTGIYTSCWDNSDCASSNCDISGAQRPLPSRHTIQSIRQLAGQGWIIPYEGTCR